MLAQQVQILVIRIYDVIMYFVLVTSYYINIVETKQMMLVTPQ